MIPQSSPARVRNIRGPSEGQALVELVLALPLLAAITLGGLTLARVAVMRADLRIATLVGVADPNPTEAVSRIAVGRGLESARLSVRSQSSAQLLRVTATYGLVPPWWPGDNRPELTLVATAARGRALLCSR